MRSAALSLLGALLPLAGAWGWGCIVWRGRAPGAVWAFAAGVPVLSLGVFLLLSAGWATSWAAGAVCALGLTGALGRGPRSLRLERPPWWTAPFLAAYGVLYLTHALAPEIEPDAAGYHLGLVAEWLRTGAFAARIGFYEILPLGVETLFLPAAAVGGYPAAKLVHLGFLAATGPVAARLAARLELPEWAGWAGWLLYALAPVTGVSGTSAYTDAAGVFFTTATFAALLEWRAARDRQWLLAAGLAAGFCYAVKLPGALVAAAAVVFPALHRSWRGAAVAGPAALAGAGPWIARAWWLTGNPFAPIANRFFPNPYFHEGAEQYLAAFLRGYGLTGWAAIPEALLLDGTALQGLLGPVWILAPLGILAAVRRPGARWLLGAAAIAALPWFGNAGARFLMPALPFAGIALAAALPRPLTAVTLAVHAVSCWPAVLDFYAGRDSWRLREFPWAVVSGAEPHEHYLERRLGDYRAARMIRTHVPPDEPLLDLYAIPAAYSGVVGVGPLPSVLYDQMADTLSRATAMPPESLDRLRCAFPLEFLRAVRWRLDQGFAAPWTIRELNFHYREHQRAPAPSWFLRARPAPQDAALACDRNLATGWHSWGPAAAGSFYEVRFHRPQPLDAVSAVMPYLRGGRLRPTVQGQRLDGAWIGLCGQPVIEPLTARPLRREAVAFLRHRGIRWVVVKDSPEGFGLVGRSMAMAPAAWGVEPVARAGDVRLFRLPD